MPENPPKALNIAILRADALPDQLGTADAPLIVMPFINAPMARRAAPQLAQRAGTGGMLLCIEDVDRRGFVATANDAFRRSAAPQFGYVAQDAYAGRSWLVQAMAKLGEGDGGLLAFNDGKWGGALAAFGLVARDWARGNYDGDLFFPGYTSHYADVELTLVAMQQRKFRFDPLALLVEVDYGKDVRTVDAADRLLYHKRAQTAFDRKVTSPSLRRMFG